MTSLGIFATLWSNHLSNLAIMTRPFWLATIAGHPLLKCLLRTNIVWRLSGLTVRTSIFATQGRWTDPDAYLERCREQMDVLGSPISSGSSVLEFGSGLGGNLLAISSKISRGIGIDINPWYAKHARHLAERCSKSNMVFMKYDGEVIPFPASSFDVVLSIGVFERLPRDRVAFYVTQMARLLRYGGLAVLYFLSPRARLTTFADRLGEDAYVFWSAKDATQIIEQAGLQINWSRGWGSCPCKDGAGSEFVADVYYATKPSRPSEDPSTSSGGL